MYGVDQYIQQYEQRARAAVEEPGSLDQALVSVLPRRPHQTPTLFLGGEKDFNVPLVGGEQMYQALRSLGVDTQLVIYPGQFHGITVPSYRIDRLERYLDWYDRYLKPARDDLRRAVGEAGSPRGSALGFVEIRAEHVLGDLRRRRTACRSRRAPEHWRCPVA